MPIIELQPFPLIKRKPSFGETRRGLLSMGTKVGKRDIRLGFKTIVVFPGDNIQEAINSLKRVGQGRVLLKNGTHKPTYIIILSSNIYIEGENAGSTIIDFNSTSNQIQVVGSDAYSTGTISITNGTLTVTGVGTTFTSAMIGRNILLRGVWYPILAVGSTTSLTIGLPFAGKTLSGATFVLATIINDVKVVNMTVKGSTLANIKFLYGNETFLQDTDAQTGATTAL